MGDQNNPKRVFEGGALMRRLSNYGLLEDDEKMLDFILALTTQKLLERRLQTVVHKKGLARTIHMARVMIRQRHISVGRQLVTIPSFMVKTSSVRHIGLSQNSAYGSGRKGRNARKAGDKNDDKEDSDA